MNLDRVRHWRCGLAACGLLVALSTGCSLQTTVGGQTLPSGYYLRDDVQYFPPGPEFKLSKQVAALEEYKLAQEGLGEPAAPTPAAAAP
jgi:hypothetical protein